MRPPLGFGKTHLAIRELCRFARLPNKTCWFIAPTRGQAKGIVWEQLKDRLTGLRWIRKVNESELTIFLINGSEITLRSADSYDRMRGYSVSFAVLDEFADMESAVWTAVRPTLSDQEGHALFIGTPRGIGNWSKDMYDMSLSNPDWASFTYSTADGGQVSPEEIAAARAELDEHSFQEEYLATFLSKSGRCYYAFDRNRNLKPYTDPIPHELHIGIDFNLSPICASVMVRKENTLHIIDEIRIFGSNTDDLVEEIKSRYPNKRIVCYPDPAGNQGRTSAGGRTDHTILRGAGFAIMAHSSTRSVRDGINAVNSKLCNSNGVSTMFIDPKLKYTIETMEKYSYKLGSSIPDKDSGFDHLADSIRYATEYMFPIRQPVREPEFKMWSHKIGTR